MMNDLDIFGIWRTLQEIKGMICRNKKALIWAEGMMLAVPLYGLRGLYKYQSEG